MRTRSFFKLTSLFAMVILAGTLSIPAAVAGNETNDVAAPPEPALIGIYNTTIGFSYHTYCPGFDYASCVYIYNGTDLVGQVTALPMDQFYVSEFACDGVGPWGQVWIGYWQTYTDTDGCTGGGSMYTWPTGEGPAQFRAAFAHVYTNAYPMP